MTRDRSFKKVVRARMHRTGEPYTAALASVRRTAPPSRPPQPGGSDMYPFERFTERAKKVLTLAQEEAERSHHSYIGTEHLLLGLLREEEGVGRQALVALGVDLETTRAKIAAVLGENERTVIQQIIPTSRVKKVIEIAFEEARRLGVGHVGTEHLLLGLLIEGEGVAAKVLDDMGVTIDRAREEVERLLREGASEPVGPASREWPAPRLLPEVSRLLVRAQANARRRRAEGCGLDDVLEAMVDSHNGIEVMARLLDLRRITAEGDQAMAAQDFEGASRLRDAERAAREALAEALATWRAELEPPPS